MKKRLISLIVAVVMLFSMLCPAAYADDETVSFDTCTHEWETPLRSGYSITIPGSDVSFSVKTEQCKKCKWYKHVATIFIAEFTYYSPLNVDANGLVPTELATYWANVWYNNFGKNATATKFTPGGGSTSGGGVGRPKGYTDDNGSANINVNGLVAYSVPVAGIDNSVFYDNSALYNHSWHPGVTSVSAEQNSVGYNGICFEANWSFDAPITGHYYVYDPYYFYNDKSHGYVTYLREANSSSSSTSGLSFDRIENRTKNTRDLASYHNSSYPFLSLYASKGDSLWFITNNRHKCVWAKCTVGSLIVYVEPLDDPVNKSNSITINNNKWNGNIYVDNSNNLTYIYPQYTTVNEKNETVTNISNNPIIYNNEIKKYYTYDTVTNNYYYITYEPQATPTPSPSPTPAPTEKPGGSISTPETGKPGGDTGDTTGILAVLVEIRDNMIQGFLDIKAAFVAGFAELSANFTLAIENLNVNIQNIFNKKFPDQSTPETALPSPSPSPAPTDPPSPSPAPDPGKPDSGDKTNNFWTIIFPNGGGSEDGKKGIFWALVSLILALIAFFANLAVGVGYLFPFLPDGVVMTINTCLIVIFLFTIIKFIMRSK